MRLKLVRIMFMVCLLGCGTCLFAQVNETISAKFTNVPFRQFVDEIEKKADCHIYYNPSELDSVTVTIEANALLLDELLRQVLLNTSFQFTIDSLRDVF